MKKKYVKFIDNGGFVLFPVSGLLVIGAVAIGAQILIGITLFVQLMLIAGYYTFKTNSIFREPLVRHSIEYCRIEAEEDAFILNTRISITAIGNIGFDESNMTLKELYEGLKKIMIVMLNFILLMELFITITDAFNLRNLFLLPG